MVIAATDRNPGLIPAHRFGALLASSRADLGLDLDALALQSGGHFTVGELASIETGRDSVRDDLLPLLSQLYNVDCRQVVPHRTKLCIDVDAKYLRVGETKEALTSTEHKHILDRYLSLVYMLRGVEPGKEIPLRNHDLAILEASLRERSELIEEQLLSAMAANDPALASLLAKFKKRLWVPGAGLLVGAVTMGALVFASPAETGSPDEESRGGGGGDRAPSTIIVAQPTALSSTDTVEVALPADSSAVSRTDAGAEQPAEASTEQLLSDASGDSTDEQLLSNASNDTGDEQIESVPAEQLLSDASDDTGDEQFVTVSAEQLLGDQALGIIGLDIEKAFPGWTVEFHNAVPGFHGLTFATEKRVEVYVQPGDTAQSLAGIVAHELGHAFDLTYMDDASRIEWMDARGVTTQWWVANGISDFQAGQGDFAEAFAHHFTGDSVHHDSQGPLTGSQQHLIERFINQHL